jgi:hypothetical protein
MNEKPFPMMHPLIFFGSFLLLNAIAAFDSLAADGFIRRTKDHQTSNKPNIKKKIHVYDQDSHLKTKIDRLTKDPAGVNWHRDDVRARSIRQEDEFPMPDGLERPCTQDEILVGVELFTDWYANETTWEIVREVDGAVVKAGYDFLDSQPYLSSFCLPKNCYKFTIRDAKGDGMCCDYGLGKFSVYTGRYFTFRHNILTGSNFGFNQSVTLGGECKPFPNNAKTKCVNMTLSLTTGDDPWSIGLGMVDLNKIGGPDYLSFGPFDLPQNTYTTTRCLYPKTCYELLAMDYYGVDDLAQRNITVVYNGMSQKLSKEDDYYMALVGDACNGRPDLCVNLSATWFTTDTQFLYQLSIQDMMTGMEETVDGQGNQENNYNKCVDPLRCYEVMLWQCENGTDFMSCFCPPSDPDLEATFTYNGTTLPPNDFYLYVGDGCEKAGAQKFFMEAGEKDLELTSSL